MKIQKFLSQSSLYVLYRGQTQVIEPFQLKLKKEGIHLLQGLILTALFFEDREVRPLELAQVLQVSKSNLSHSLRALEKRGWLKRSLHPQDARGYLFSLTAQGRKKALVLVKIFDKTESELEDSAGAKNVRDWLQSSRSILSHW